MAPGCPSSEVRDLDGGGREKFGKKTRNSLGAAHVSLGGLFCFLVTVVGGGDSLHTDHPKPSFHSQGQM